MFLRGLDEDERTLSCGADHYDMHTSTRLIADDTFYLATVCLKRECIAFHPSLDLEIWHYTSTHIHIGEMPFEFFHSYHVAIQGAKKLHVLHSQVSPSYWLEDIFTLCLHKGWTMRIRTKVNHSSKQCSGTLECDICKTQTTTKFYCDLFFIYKFVI